MEFTTDVEMKAATRTSFDVGIRLPSRSAIKTSIIVACSTFKDHATWSSKSCCISSIEIHDWGAEEWNSASTMLLCISRHHGGFFCHN